MCIIDLDAFGCFTIATVMIDFNHINASCVNFGFGGFINISG